MTDKIIKREHENNLKGGWRSFPDTALRRSWSSCIDRGMDPESREIYLCGESEEFEIKEKTQKLYAYSNRLISSIFRWCIRPLAYVMVDGGGVVLKIYCGGEIRAWLEEQGIQEWCNLSEEYTGPTAFSLGLKEKEPFRTSGSDHYLSRFLGMTMYFAPCVLEDNSQERFGELELLGGIGIITPRTEHFEDYLATAITMSKEVCLHLDMVNTFYNFYMSETMGYICVDIDGKTRKPYCLYHNSNIFNVLNIPFSDLCFKSLSTVFDPLPANEEFWKILSNNEHLHDVSISLSVRGVTRQYVVSTVPYQQVSVGYEGMRFFISNKEKVTSFVSRQIGNNAILTFHDIIGQSREIKQSIQFAEKYAQFDNNVLIMGESGAGKDIFAQAIHNASARRNGPFIAVNCATFPRDLMVSELFGYEQGAFTGSRKNGNMGKLELANNGTLFLDEIGTLPLDLQAILLRVLETKRFIKLGAQKETSVDVRIIAATNADILEMVSQRGFREDLYFRLSSFVLNIPPLRKRSEDLVLLANHFIERVASRIHIAPPQIAEDAVEYMRKLAWKGNVRELQNLMEGIVQIYSPSVITKEHITEYLKVVGMAGHSNTEPEEKLFVLEVPESRETAVKLTEQTILEALDQCKWNKSKAAEFLGVSRKTLYKWMGRFQMLD